MQGRLDFDGLKPRLLDIHEHLDAHFGHRQPVYLRLDPVSQLVMSLLGGRTRSEQSKAGFIALLQRFGDWQSVRDARLHDVLDCLPHVTFAENKAPRLQASLGIITGHDGRPTLDHLSGLTTPQAQTWLETLPGVGPKVASAVLNFSTLQRRSLVVDTHHQRVARRLGLIRTTMSLGSARHVLMASLPDSWSAAKIERHHGLVKGLGQTLCTFRDRYCESCPLQKLCPTGRRGGRCVHPGTMLGTVSHAKLRPHEWKVLSKLDTKVRQPTCPL